MKLKRCSIAFLLVMGIVINATIVEAKPKPITSSVGNSDLAKYKTFSVASSSAPNTPQFLRDIPMLQDIAFRFSQEGFKFINKMDNADFVIVMCFIDATGQDYIPPTSYTSVNYDPGFTTTNTTGMMTGMGNFVNFQANSQSTSTASASATTMTRGGYFVPNYGVAIALNIYDTKTKALIWSGAGASRADIQNVYTPIDKIILDLIDNNLITPAFLKGEREKIRKGKIGRQDEFLKPDAPLTNVGYYVNNYKDEIDGFGILASVCTQGQLLSLNMSIKNNTTTDFEFDPTTVKVSFQGENLYVFSKSEVADSYFKARGPGPKESSLNLIDNGILGVMIGSMIEGISNSNAEIKKKKIDETIRFVYENYADKHTIKPGEFYGGYFFVAGPMILPQGEKVKVIIPLRNKNFEGDFVLQERWLTVPYWKKEMAKLGVKASKH